MLPPSRKPRFSEEGGGGEGDSHRTPFFALLRVLPPLGFVQPMWRWAPRPTVSDVDGDGGESGALGNRSGGRVIDEAEVERYNNTLGDKRWFYAEIASFGCSLLVGAMEGVPAARCRPRAVVALIAATLQCGLSLTTVVPIELALQSLLACCIIPLSIAVTAKVFSDDDGAGDSGSDGDDGVSAAIDALSLVGNMVGIGLMAVGVVRGAFEMLTSYRRRAAPMRGIDATANSRQPRFRSSRSTGEFGGEGVGDGGDDDDRDSADSVPLASLSVGPADVPTLPRGSTAVPDNDPLALGDSFAIRGGGGGNAVAVSPSMSVPIPIPAVATNTSDRRGPLGPSFGSDIGDLPLAVAFPGEAAVAHSNTHNFSSHQPHSTPIIVTKYVGGGDEEQQHSHKHRPPKVKMPSTRTSEGGADAVDSAMGPYRFSDPYAAAASGGSNAFSYGDGPMPPSFEDFKGPRWQAELLYRVEQAAKEKKARLGDESGRL